MVRWHKMRPKLTLTEYSSTANAQLLEVKYYNGSDIEAFLRKGQQF